MPLLGGISDMLFDELIFPSVDYKEKIISKRNIPFL
jgi:hypothetical protein